MRYCVILRLCTHRFAPLLCWASKGLVLSVPRKVSVWVIVTRSLHSCTSGLVAHASLASALTALSILHLNDNVARRRHPHLLLLVPGYPVSSTRAQSAAGYYTSLKGVC